MIRKLFARRRFMREHHWTHAHLSGYVDEELGADDLARVEDHVSLCPHCHRVLATLRRTLEGLRALPAEPEPGLADGVIKRLREEG